jgi:hypothetical protein
VIESERVERRVEAATTDGARQVPRRGAVVQRKLTVGSASDPLEDEADRVADEVMRVLRSTSAAAPSPALGNGHPSRIRRHASADHHDHGGPEVGFAGGAISPELSSRITAASGGAPLAARTRSRMEHGFGVGFGDVRVHADSELPRQVAADAFTTGTHLHFAPGLYDPSSSAGERLLAHELTHVVQQGGAVARHVCDSACDHEIARHVCDSACGHDVGAGPEIGPGHAHDAVSRSIAASITVADTGGAVRRHSSWEHMMIGDLDPKSLATLGAQKDVQIGGPHAAVYVGDDVNGHPVNVTAGDVKHVIQQEIQRLKLFQGAPPMVTSYEDIAQHEQDYQQADAQATIDRVSANSGLLAGLAAAHANPWDLKLVGVPNRSGQIFLVTYGEMNTLGDYFGSVEEMENVDPKWIGKLIRGVRESALRELVKIYATVSGFTFGLAGSAEQQARDELGVDDEKFRSGHGKDNAVDLGGVANELKLMGALPSGFAKPKVDGDATTDYSSTLARNACHFAPESWHAWGGFHDKARAYALQSFQAAQAAIGFQQGGFVHQAKVKRAQAAELRNRAMLNNGFGDHYLQDSYAAGHLINKTRIMQQYVKWLDAHPDKWDAHRDKNWRKVQQMAYNQPGLTDAGQYNKANVGQARQSSSGVALESGRNPQTSENVQGTWKDKAEALGLQVPASLGDVNAKSLLVHWQTKCVTQLKVRNPRVQTWRTVKAWAASIGIGGPATLAAINALFRDGIVRKDDYSTDDRVPGYRHTLEASTKLTLRDEYVPSGLTKLASITAGPGAAAAYSDMALGVAYNDYLEFMNSSFLQKSTNFIHNEFCENGLEVSTGAHDPVFTVYGDDNMFNANAGEGLMHSGETAHMSRNSIVQIADTGATVTTKAAILDRLPAFVQVAGNNAPLDQWGDDLGGQLDNLFDKMSNVGEVFINKTVVGVKGSLGKVSNDRPSGHEVF